MGVTISTMSNSRSTKIALGAGCLLSIFRPVHASSDEQQAPSGDAKAESANGVPPVVIPYIPTGPNGECFWTQWSDGSLNDAFTPEAARGRPDVVTPPCNPHGEVTEDTLKRLDSSHSLYRSEDEENPKLLAQQLVAFDSFVQTPTGNSPTSSQLGEENPPDLETTSESLSSAGSTGSDHWLDNDPLGAVPKTAPSRSPCRRENRQTSHTREPEPKRERIKPIRKTSRPMTAQEVKYYKLIEKTVPEYEEYLSNRADMRNFKDFDYNAAANVVRMKLELAKKRGAGDWYQNVVLPFFKNKGDSKLEDLKAFLAKYGCKRCTEFEKKVLSVARKRMSALAEALERHGSNRDWAAAEFERFTAIPSAKPGRRRKFLANYACSTLEELSLLLAQASGRKQL